MRLRRRVLRLLRLELLALLPRRRLAAILELLFSIRRLAAMTADVIKYGPALINPVITEG